MNMFFQDTGSHLNNEIDSSSVSNTPGPPAQPIGTRDPQQLMIDK